MNAVVTGTNRGIGNAVVKAFAENGINVWAHARAENPGFEAEMAQAAEKNNVRIIPIYFDMNSEEEIKRGVQMIVSSKEPVDILVNNAGITCRNPFFMQSVDEIKKVYDINFFHPLLFTQLISKYMIRRKQGCIVNIASTDGIDNTEGALAYGGSKSSVVWATKTLAAELGKYNIRVNTVAPGLIDTDMINYRTPEQKQSIIDDHCIIKRIGTARDIANAVVFLTSENASYITGQTLRVDGGRI